MEKESANLFKEFTAFDRKVCKRFVLMSSFSSAILQIKHVKTRSSEDFGTVKQPVIGRVATFICHLSNLLLEWSPLINDWLEMRTWVYLQGRLKQHPQLEKYTVWVWQRRRRMLHWCLCNYSPCQRMETEASLCLLDAAHQITHKMSVNISHCSQ